MLNSGGALPAQSVLYSHQLQQTLNQSNPQVTPGAPYGQYIHQNQQQQPYFAGGNSIATGYQGKGDFNNNNTYSGQLQSAQPHIQ